MPRPAIHRLLPWLASLALALPTSVSAQPADATLAVLDFDLIEEHVEPGQAADMRRRVLRMEEMLAQGLAERGLYRVVELGEARTRLAELRRQQEHMHRCGACQVEMGRAVGTKYVVAGWVQKVSNLILNINIELREVASDRVVLNKSVDIRGNNDRAWEHGMRFLLRDFAEKRAANPDYGL